MRERNFLCRERVKTNAHARSTAEAKNQDGASFVYVRIKEYLSKINTVVDVDVDMFLLLLVLLVLLLLSNSALLCRLY